MENKKIKFPIAAIFFAIITAIQLIDLIQHPAFAIGFILDLINPSIGIFLCFVLFTKRCDKLLLTAIILKVLWSIRYLFWGFTWQRISEFCIWLMILAITLICFDFAFINKKLNKYRALVSKLFFIPALLQLVVTSVNVLYDFFGYYGVWGLDSIIDIMNLFAIFMLTLWLVNPYVNEKKPNQDSPNNYISDEANKAYCSIGKHILLLLFTFGIWPLIWIYRITNYLNKAPNAPIYTPTNQLLLCIFVPFYQIYWLYKHGQKIDNLAKSQNINTSDMATICLILGIFIPVVAYIIMQDRINTICLNKAK